MPPPPGSATGKLSVQPALISMADYIQLSKTNSLDPNHSLVRNDGNGIMQSQEKAQEMFNRISRRLAVGSASSEAGVRQDMYGRLSLTLVRENAKAILARSSWPVS